jgi:large subunit ribosomal protein L25
MTEILPVRIREGKKTLKQLRGGKEMPAVFYGPKEKSTPIAIETDAFKKLWKKAGESTVITLTGDGIDKEALIHEVNVNPVTGEPRHADFYVMEKGKKVTVSVPLEFIGIPPAVKELGGVLVKVMHEIEIEVLPKDLPHNITVDVTSLNDFENRIFAKDIVIPESAELITDAEDVVALVNEVQEEKEPEVELTLEDIEVEQKGKKPEEGEEVAETPEA